MYSPLSSQGGEGKENQNAAFMNLLRAKMGEFEAFLVQMQESYESRFAEVAMTVKGQARDLRLQQNISLALQERIEILEK